MSLRLRLVLLTLALVAFVALILSALQVESLVDTLSKTAMGRASIAADQATNSVIDRITTRVSEPAAAESAESPHDLWIRILKTDAEIPEILKRTMTQGYFIQLLRINIQDASGNELVSFPENVVGTAKREAFSSWIERPWYRRAIDLFTNHPDWEVSGSAVGFDGEPVFRVQVLTSSLLLRGELVDPIRTLALVSSTAIGIALVLVWLAAHSALRPLQRIERTIDRMTQGSFEAGEAASPLAKEFQAVESKLNILGQRIQDSRAAFPGSTQEKLDLFVERVATEIDVAKRLSAISRLSGGVAHEIKNPLNAILLRLDLLKVRLGESDEEVTGELEILSKEVLRLNRVVTTFLDFSRPVEVNFEEVDLAALAREMVELIRPQAEIAHIDVEFSAPEEPALMRGDPDLLKQAILNLVTNAIEAMGSSGGSLRLTVERNGGNWVLKVADSGPGIPPELRAKVFQLYFTSKARGSGIGLAMTYRAAQLHNGTIDFASESGVGTTFRLEFPATVTHV